MLLYFFAHFLAYHKIPYFPLKCQKEDTSSSSFWVWLNLNCDFSENQGLWLSNTSDPLWKRCVHLVLWSRKVVPKGTLPCSMSSELFCNCFGHLMASGHHGELEFLLISLSITRITSTLKFSLSRIPCNFTTMHKPSSWRSPTWHHSLLDTSYSSFWWWDYPHEVLVFKVKLNIELIFFIISHIY